ncbi:dTDP-4-dehydrorhamnose reductase [Seleniivibrio woodruffii]|uniref:dTDP-4-dehydrorhamnose reductase n=1 Tax=Seleniivibrio woodruffii TaxID=1078050 RepID=UPI00240A5F66|nr:dTDP-4-dehydrorhamnose reductase [Seleniivibrio woodruffii]
MIWLTGCRGMLGRELALVFEREGLDFTGTGSETDITDPEAVRQFIENRRISWIVNCSAYTAVDKAEQESGKAESINRLGVRNLALAAEKLNAKMIHFSTDYVFRGDSGNPYRETDETGPVSAYGRTKLAGEQELVSACSKYFIFRISWLYGLYGGNFVRTMLRLMNERDSLGVVCDQRGAPTYAAALADNIAMLIKSDKSDYGIYHYSDDGDISWYDFASEIYEYGKKAGLIRKNTVISPITSDQYQTAAVRPAMSVFNRDKVVRVLGFCIKDWKTNLHEYLERIANENL